MAEKRYSSLIVSWRGAIDRGKSMGYASYSCVESALPHVHKSNFIQGVAYYQVVSTNINDQTQSLAKLPLEPTIFRTAGDVRQNEAIIWF